MSESYSADISTRRQTWQTGLKLDEMVRGCFYSCHSLEMEVSVVRMLVRKGIYNCPLLPPEWTSVSKGTHTFVTLMTQESIFLAAVHTGRVHF